ncbi:hypothetical protein [Catenulispora subtropica]|uniref:Uncharacterized protein n=1 Tax=Catenulispora subtropica TaxID=450798 RepID=A0ABP5CA68_9ACTN
MVNVSLAWPEGNPDEQLFALGLGKEDLLKAISAGEDARARATPNHPITTAGQLDYQERVFTLREVLFKRGWKRLDHRGSPLVVNPDRTIAIGVLLGDHRTGLPGRPDPRPVRPQGAAKAELIDRNNMSPLFPLSVVMPDSDQAHLEDDELAGLQTWYLLTHRYTGKKNGVIGVRSELSLPVNIGPQEKIDTWLRRILLPTMEWEIVVDYPGEQPPGYDVRLEER